MLGFTSITGGCGNPITQPIAAPVIIQIEWLGLKSCEPIQVDFVGEESNICAKATIGNGGQTFFEITIFGDSEDNDAEDNSGDE